MCIQYRDLLSVLAGTAAAADRRLDAVNCCGGRRHEQHGHHRGRHPGQDICRLRALERNQRLVLQPPQGRHSGQRPLDQGKIGLLAGGIDDQEQRVLY